MVVIVIIGVLTTLVTVAITTGRAKARDGKRLADVAEFQNSVEAYYNAVGSYPPYATSGEPLIANGRTFMAKIPTAVNIPDGSCPSDNYTYESLDPANSYTIAYCLGGAVRDYNPGLAVANPNTIHCGIDCTNKCAPLSDGCGGSCPATCSEPGFVCQSGTCVDPHPTVQVLTLKNTSPKKETVTLTWTRGNGQGAVIFFATGSTVVKPTDGVVYNCSTPNYSLAEEISSGSRCLYSGISTTLYVTGLTGATNYKAEAFEYNIVNDVYYYLKTDGTNITSFKTPLR